MTAKLTLHTEYILFSKQQWTTERKTNLSQNVHEPAKCACAEKIITVLLLLLLLLRAVG